MKYIKRFLNIISIIPKFFGKSLAILGYILLLSIHAILAFATTPIVLLLHLVELVTVRFFYYVATGKKYSDTYNKFIDMWISLIHLERPIRNKERQEEYYDYIYTLINRDKYWTYLDYKYGTLWNKIQSIDLKLKYE